MKKQFNIRTVIYSWLFITNFLLPTPYSFSQGIWTQKSNFGGAARMLAVGFSIGAKGYIGTGQDGNTATYYQDFWEWDQATNVWTQKADFGGGARSIAVGFSIGTKGYIGTGYNGSAAGAYKDFWEWDQNTNIWTKKSDFGGGVKYYEAGFSIGAKGYIGTGWNGAFTNDFWEWDQTTDVWTKKANFGGSARNGAVGFSIGAKGYIGTGYYSSGAYQDFWEWDQLTNVWTQKAVFGGGAITNPVGFSIGTKGYIGTGENAGVYKYFWEWDQGANAWTQKSDFGGVARGEATGFSIGCRGYIGTGRDPSAGNMYNDFWEYTPSPDPCGTLNISVSSQNVLCNGQCTGTGTVTPASGNSPYIYNWNTLPLQTTQTATGLCAGTYTVIVTDVASVTATATLVITQPTVLTVTVISTSAACGNNNGTATVNASGGTPGYTYSWNPAGVTTSTATGLASGNYTVTITDANNCTTSQTVTVVSSGSITVSQPVIICSGSIYTLPGGTIVSTSGTYIDTLTSTNGCDSIITTTLTVVSVFTTSQSASICTGSSYTLPGGTVVSTGGTYNDTLTSVAGCDSIITTTLTVNPNPTANASSNITITQGQNVTLTASGGGTYSWSPAASGVNGSSITVSPLVTTMYCVTVTDANNCTDTACVTISIEQIDCSLAGELYLPNAFSPNGDGENDFLQVFYGNMNCISSLSIAIYNRWGERVLHTSDPFFKWDGSYQSVLIDNMAEGIQVLVYYLDVSLVTGNQLTMKGNVSLIK